MLNNSDKKLLNTLTIDIIDTEGTHNDPSTLKIHNSKLTEIRKLLWMSIRLYYNYTELYGIPQQKQRSLFWTKAENITYNIPLVLQYNTLHLDIIEDLLSDIIVNGFNSKEILETLLTDNSKTIAYLNYSEQLFNHILQIYNTQVNLTSTGGTRHIFIDNENTGIDIDDFSGPFIQVRQALLSSELFTREFGNNCFNYWDISLSENENTWNMNIKFHNKQIIPELPIPLLFQDIFDSISPSLTLDNVNCWGSNNPNSNFFCSIREIYNSLLDKKTRLSVRKSFLELGISDDIIEKIISREITGKNFIEDTQLINIFLNDLIDISVSTKTDNHYWYQTNPLLGTVLTHYTDNSIETSPRNCSLESLTILKNHIYLLNKSGFLTLPIANQVNLYYPPFTQHNMGINIPLSNYQLDGQVTNQFWFKGHSFTKQLYLAASDNNNTSRDLFNYNCFNINYRHYGLSNNIINIIDIFNIVKLSERFPASQLNSKLLSNKSVKLYTPTIFYENVSSNSVPKSTIVDWIKCNVSTVLNSNQKIINLDTSNNISFLVKLQAEIKQPNMLRDCEILSILDGVARFRYLDDNSVHYDIPLFNIVLNSVDISKIKVGDQLKVYEYYFVYGTIILTTDGNISLYSDNHINNIDTLDNTLQLYYNRLNDFLQLINLTSYLINNLENFPLQLINLNFNQTNNNVKWLSDCPFGINFNLIKQYDIGTDINLSVLNKLLELYKPIIQLVPIKYIEGQVIQVRLSEKDKSWTIAKLVSINLDDKTAQVKLKNNQTETIVNIDDNIRTIKESKEPNTIRYLFNINGVQQVPNNISCLLHNLKRFNISKRDEINILSRDLQISKRDTEKYYKLINIEFPKDSCQVSIVIHNKTQFSYTVDNCNNYDVALMSLKTMNFIVDIYKNITTGGVLNDIKSIPSGQPHLVDIINVLDKILVGSRILSLQQLSNISNDSDEEKKSNVPEISQLQSIVLGTLQNEDNPDKPDTPDKPDSVDSVDSSELVPSLGSPPLSDKASDSNSDDDSDSDSDDDFMLTKHTDVEAGIGETVNDGTGDVDGDYTVSVDNQELYEEDDGDSIYDDKEEDYMDLFNQSDDDISDPSHLSEPDDTSVSYSSREPQRWWPDRNPLLERINTYITSRNKTETDSDDQKQQTRKKSYSTECQTHVRQPMIITDATKQYIDKYYKNSYGHQGSMLIKGKTQTNISCNKESQYDDDNSCIAVGLENNNWVICPVLSCLHCWISIHPDQLLPNDGNIDQMALFIHNVNKISDIDKLLDNSGMSVTSLVSRNSDTLPSEIKDVDGLRTHLTQVLKEKPVQLKVECKKFVTKDPTLATEDWIKCKNCEMDIFNHNVKCPICKRGLQLDNIGKRNERQTKLWERVDTDRGFWKIYKLGDKKYKKEVCSNKELEEKRYNKSYEKYYTLPAMVSGIPNRSILVRSSPNNDEMYIYPAFLDSLSPCCFQATSTNKNLDEFYGKVTKRQSESKYILKANKPLPANRKGMLPPILTSIFGNGIPGFVRLGTVSNANNFLEILTLIDSTLTLDIIKRHIVSSLDDTKFRSLSGGSLHVLFSDRDYRISPLQNFLEYTISETYKQEYLYLDIFKHIGLPTRTPLPSLQIVILSLENETDLTNDTLNERLYIRCNPGVNEILPEVPTILILKREFSNFSSEKVYEPIIYTNGPSSSRPDIIYFKFRTGQKKSIVVEEHSKLYLGEDILKLFNNSIKKCRQYPQGDSVPFPFDFLHTNFQALENSLDKQRITGQYITSGNQTIGVILDNTQYIPIFPREPFFSIPNVELSDICHCKSITNTILELITIHNLGEFKCNPKWLVKKQIAEEPFQYIGILTEQGYYIPCEATSKSLTSINEELDGIIVLQDISYDIDTISKLVDDTEIPSKNMNDYQTPKNINETLAILHGLSKNLDKYTPIGVVLSKNLVVIKSGLLIPYHTIRVPTQNIQLDGDYQAIISLKSKLDKYQIIEQGLKHEISDRVIDFLTLDKYHEETTELYSRTTGDISNRIFRTKYCSDTHLIDKILTESGVEIPVKKTEFININQAGKIICKSLLLPIIQLPEKTHIKALGIYENNNQDDRVTDQQIENLRHIQYKSLRQEISKFISLNSDLQTLFTNISDNLPLPVSFKKTIIYIICMVIVDVITDYNNNPSIYENLIDSYKLKNCVYLPSQECKRTKHCSWTNNINNIIINKRIQYLIKNIFTLLSDSNFLQRQFIENGVGYNSSLSKIKNIITLVKSIDDNKPSKPDEGTCQIALSNKFQPDISDNYVEQLAEELVHINFRSTEILGNMINDNFKKSSIIRDGDEITINKLMDEKMDHFLKQIDELLNSRFTRNYFSNKIPFNLVVTNTSRYFSYSTVKQISTKLLIDRSNLVEIDEIEQVDTSILSETIDHGELDDPIGTTIHITDERDDLKTVSKISLTRHIMPNEIQDIETMIYNVNAPILINKTKEFSIHMTTTHKVLRHY